MADTQQPPADNPPAYTASEGANAEAAPATGANQKTVKCIHCRKDVPVDDATFERSKKAQVVGARKDDIQCPHCQKFFYPVWRNLLLFHELCSSGFRGPASCPEACAESERLRGHLLAPLPMWHCLTFDDGALVRSTCTRLVGVGERTLLKSPCKSIFPHLAALPLSSLPPYPPPRHELTSLLCLMRRARTSCAPFCKRRTMVA